MAKEFKKGALGFSLTTVQRYGRGSHFDVHV